MVFPVSSSHIQHHTRSVADQETHTSTAAHSSHLKEGTVVDGLEVRRSVFNDE